MIITRRQLRRLIKEELSRVLLEQTAEPIKASEDAKKAAEERLISQELSKDISWAWATQCQQWLFGVNLHNHD